MTGFIDEGDGGRVSGRQNFDRGHTGQLVHVRTGARSCRRVAATGPAVLAARFPDACAAELPPPSRCAVLRIRASTRRFSGMHTS